MDQLLVGLLHEETTRQLFFCLLFSRMPRFFSPQKCFLSGHVFLHEAIPPQVQDFAFVELHEVFIHPVLQPDKIPLPDIPTLQLTTTPYPSLIR